MDASIISTQITTAAAGAYVLRLIQKWDKLPWITAHTQGVSVAMRAALAFIGTVGITWKWDGADHVLTITGLSLVTIGAGLWHVFSLYAMQHAWGQLFNVGTTSKIETPLEVVNVKGDKV